MSVGRRTLPGMNMASPNGMRGSTKARQQTIVGEGLALGCVGVGLVEFSDHKMTIELSLEQAWRDWQYRDFFPAVHVGIARNDLLGIVHRSPRRRGPRVAGWAGEWPFLPYVEDGLELAEAGDVLEGESGVPLSGWLQLANTFRARLLGPAN
jgi:hypothetical protein